MKFISGLLATVAVLGANVALAAPAVQDVSLSPKCLFNQWLTCFTRVLSGLTLPTLP